MDRRKELKEQYKQMKTEMGVFLIRSKTGNKGYIEATPNLKGKMNGTRFKLVGGGHPNLELQKDWGKHGEANFTVEVLEVLEYDKDEAKTDYSDELALLQMIWEEKLAKEGMEFYKKKI